MILIKSVARLFSTSVCCVRFSPSSSSFTFSVFFSPLNFPIARIHLYSYYVAAHNHNDENDSEIGVFGKCFMLFDKQENENRAYNNIILNKHLYYEEIAET